jgi:hypothetical protein
MPSQKPLPTDLQILNAIYNRYYDAFVAFDSDPSIRRTKIYVPIDSALIAADLGVDPDIVFGRLHYSLEQRHAYTDANGGTVHFFTHEVEEGSWTVHFPYLGSALADLRYTHRQSTLATWLAAAALVVSIVALFT